MPASFVMAFYVDEWSCEDAYVASRLDGQTTNCEISGSVISVYFNSPGFTCGQLKCRVYDSVDNADFTDGTLDTCTPLTLPVEIVATAGDSEVISLYTDGYQPPATGIPKGDLEQSVQDTLDSVANKVDKETGKGLSTNDYTTAEKTKLAGIKAGAQANVKADWNAESGDAQILNKPTIPTKVSDLTNDSGFLDESSFDISSLQDGTVVFVIGSDTYTVDLNHEHPQYVEAEDLADVATSGSYNDLTDKPTIPSLNGYVKFWTGTQAQYEALAPNYDSDTLYLIPETT